MKKVENGYKLLEIGILMNNVRNLRIYIKAIGLVREIYLLIKNNSALSRDYSLCDQLKRASVSVSANISEGYARTRKQFKNYLEIAKGSANEILTLLEIIQLVYDIQTIEIQVEYNILAKQITVFTKTF